MYWGESDSRATNGVGWVIRSASGILLGVGVMVLAGLGLLLLGQIPR